MVSPNRETHFLGGSMANWLSLAHFVRKVGGVDHVYDITEKINNGCKQADVARAYGLDPGYLSRTLSCYFQKCIIPQEDTLIFLTAQVSRLEEHNGNAGRVRARIFDIASRRPTDQKADGQ